jgi:hypothetical protein
LSAGSPGNGAANAGGGGNGGGGGRAGAVIIAFSATLPDPTIGAGLTYNVYNNAPWRVIEFTAGSDQISWG